MIRNFLVISVLNLCFICTTSHAEAFNSATVFDDSRFAEAQKLKKIIAQPENSIDFARAKLTIDKMVDPTINIEANLKKIDAMAKAIRSMLPFDATSMNKMLAIKEYLYVAGAWNDYRPYSYDFTDPLGTKIKNKLLPTYLATRKGNCFSMPLLFIILSQKLGIDVTASTAPSHMMVKFTDDVGQTYNIETTNGAHFARDVWYQQTMHITDQALDSQIYLKKLSKQETIAAMATILAEDYFVKHEYEKAMMISDVVLKYFKTDIDMMVIKGSLFYLLLQKHYFSKYPQPNLIPINERPYYEFLSSNNRYWFEKAESLGWRQPSKEEDENYLATVKQNATMKNP